MKHTMKAIVATLLLMLTSLAAQGATVTIDDGLTHGSITQTVSGTTVTLTATPEAGYFLCFDDLSVKAFVDGGSAEGRKHAPIPMYTIAVTNNGDGTYTFTMPTEGYDVYVSAVFRQATMTLPSGSYPYNGSAQTPPPTVKIDGTTLVASTDYTVGYTNNENVGTNTATVTATGKGKYFGTVAMTFSISAKALTITAKSQTVTYGTAISSATDQVAIDGLQGTDALTSITLTASTPDVTTSGTITASAAVITKSGNNMTANYVITFVPGVLTINPKEVGLTWNPNPASFIYTGSPQAPTATVTELIGTDACTVTDYSIAATGGSSLIGGKAVNVGNYTVTATTLSNANYKLPTAASTEFSIGTASMAGEVSASGWSGTYDGAAHKITVTAPAGATVKYRETASGSYDLTTNPTYTNVGNYTIYYEVTKAGFASAYGSETVTINQKEAGLTWSPDPATFTYTGSAQAPTATVTGLIGTDACTVTDYSIAATGSSSLTGGAAVNVGNYTVTATTLSNANYKLPTAASMDFSIIEASMSGEISTTGWSGTYDGTAHKITVTAPTGATVKYRETTSGSYGLTTSPEYTNAGNYTVYYEVTKAGFASAYGSETVTINPKEVGLTWSPDPATFTYTGSAQAPTATVTGLIGTDACTVTDYSIAATGSSSLTGGAAVNVGNYTVTAKALNNANYKLPTAASTEFGITARVLTIKAIDQTVTYGTDIVKTKDKVTVTAGALQGTDAITAITLTPSTTNATTTGTITPSAAVIKNGGTDVTANYAITFDTGVLTINAKTLIEGGDGTLNITLTPASAVYDGNAHEPTITVKDGGTPLTLGMDYTVTYQLAAVVVPEMKNANVYTVVIANKTGGNYNFSVNKTFEITKASVIVTITGHNNTIVYDGVEHSITGYDVDISNALYKETDLAFTGTAVAARTEEGTTNMGLDQSQFTNTNTNFTVTFNVTDGYQTITSLTDVVVTITGHKNTIDYDGMAHNVSGYDVSISNPLYKETDFTFSGTAVAARTDAGTTNMGLDASQFTNNNTSFTSVTFNVTDGYQTIMPVALTLTADALEKAIGTDDPALTFGVIGLKGSDTKESVMTGTLQRATGESVGSYAITQGSLSANSNYIINFTGANFVIYRALDGIFADGNEWATFVAEENLTIPSGLEAFVVNSVSGSTVNTEVAAFVAKGVGILLKRTDKTVNSYRGYAYNGTAPAPESLLEGSATAATDIANYQDYVLYNDQFELAGVSSVGKGHAYLPKTVIGNASGARSLSISTNGIGTDPDGIDSVFGDDKEAEGNWYDLNGRKLNGRPTKKGLYIKDGHKVVIK